jgi:hypothetical protein
METKIQGEEKEEGRRIWRSGKGGKRERRERGAKITEKGENLQKEDDGSWRLI